MRTNVLIYEDNENLRHSLVELLSREKEFNVIGDYPNCLKVETELQKLHPDVVLMDIDLPEINGIEAVKKIRANNTKVHILMLTVFDDTTSVFDALYAGANGYLLKKYVSTRLIDAIKDVLEGGSPMSPGIARLIINDIQQKGAPKSAIDYNLTPREIDVLISLAKGNSYKMVADDLTISIETVRSHIKNVYDKLHVQSQGEAISKALREGLID
ncbi:response regulator transcription factor [uncultured Aquimarina sp.]|uniref:response regulator n=1 Tax=uncultured Aquimarina sp. TaxID=575652 RepID=UPI002629D420|nr:response regulator transcription factor [uncultured Aquimarina sp.]